MDDIPPDTPAPTVEYETCMQCDGSLYRGVSVDGKRRGTWHHHNRRMQHEPEVYETREEELIVDMEIDDSAEIAARSMDNEPSDGGES
ncbi:MAG: hypothetical protein GY926_18580 [bacterium]|nr:hypothetical protein [bacterium]